MLAQFSAFRGPVDLRPRVDRESEVLPPDVPVHVRTGAGRPRGDQSELGLVVPLPRHRSLGIVAFNAERVQHRVELRDTAGEVVDGDSEVVEHGHAIEFSRLAVAGIQRSGVSQAA